VICVIAGQRVKPVRQQRRYHADPSEALTRSTNTTLKWVFTEGLNPQTHRIFYKCVSLGVRLDCD